MTTLADVRGRVADMLARSDLNSQIDAEIILACKRYSRKITWISETRGGTLATVIGQTMYATFDLSPATAVQDVTGRTAVSFEDVLKIEYLRDADSAAMKQVRASDFEAFLDVTGNAGSPNYFTLYAGSLGLWPVPDAVETLTLVAVVKPAVPALATDESAWFDHCQELIECAAAQAVCMKFIQDPERAAMFAAMERVHFDDMVKESGLKMSTGKLKAHD